MAIKACVRCGYCCKKSLCDFGDREPGVQQCKYLGGENPGEYYCKIHDQIIQKVWAKWNPAFGAGCCASLNTARRSLIQSRGLGDVYVPSSDSDVQGDDLSGCLVHGDDVRSKEGQRIGSAPPF